MALLAQGLVVPVVGTVIEIGVVAADTDPVAELPVVVVDGYPRYFLEDSFSEASNGGILPNTWALCALVVRNLNTPLCHPWSGSSAAPLVVRILGSFLGPLWVHPRC